MENDVVTETFTQRRSERKFYIHILLSFFLSLQQTKSFVISFVYVIV